MIYAKIRDGYLSYAWDNKCSYPVLRLASDTVTGEYVPKLSPPLSFLDCFME